MRPVPLVVAVAAALGSAPALAAPPTTPSDLRVDVYSGTAAELFWGRSSDPDGAVSRYEIRRDGQLVDTRDGLSYFTDDLTDGRAFAFTVTAVDFDGERSAPAAVSVVGGDRGGAVGSGGGRPTPPANLTSSVYSSSAAEVFWDRSDQRGLSYEVSVDGGPVTTTNGTSAFLSGLDGTRGRGVDVVAIDANGQRSGAANVTLGGGSGGGNPMEPVTPPSGGDAPAAPSSLRAERYSSNAGEVFWDRVSGTNLSYEVSLDGEVVSTTTGTSYFAGSVPGIDGTRVEVVAIGPDGVRSSASSTTIGSGGTSNPDPDPDPNPGTGVPPAPANARVEVYSGTAAEIFFDRAPASANVAGTEIVRDGETLGTTNGTSFFDQGRVPGIDYRYELIAVNRQGVRSETSTVGSSTTEPPTVTSFDPAPERLFALLAGEPVDVLADYAERPFDDGTPERDSIGAFTLIETVREPDGFPTRVRFACEGGGEYEKPAFQAQGQGGVTERTFSGCAIDGLVYDGTLSSSQGTVTIDDFSVTRGGEIVFEADGAVSNTGSRSGNVRTIAWSFDRYADAESGVSLRDSSVSEDFNGRGTSRPIDQLSVELTVTAPWTNGTTLSGSTGDMPFDGRNDGATFYTTGRLALDQEDGPRGVSFEADSGDSSTYVWTVQQEGGATSDMLSWSTLLDNCAQPGTLLGVAFQLSLCESR